MSALLALGAGDTGGVASFLSALSACRSLSGLPSRAARLGALLLAVVSEKDAKKSSSSFVFDDVEDLRDDFVGVRLPRASLLAAFALTFSGLCFSGIEAAFSLDGVAAFWLDAAEVVVRLGLGASEAI